MFVLSFRAVFDAVALKPRRQAEVVCALELGRDAAVDSLRRLRRPRRRRRRPRRRSSREAASFVFTLKIEGKITFICDNVININGRGAGGVGEVGGGRREEEE